MHNSLCSFGPLQKISSDLRLRMWMFNLVLLSFSLLSLRVNCVSAFSVKKRTVLAFQSSRPCTCITNANKRSGPMIFYDLNNLRSQLCMVPPNKLVATEEKGTQTIFAQTTGMNISSSASKGDAKMKDMNAVVSPNTITNTTMVIPDLSLSVEGNDRSNAEYRRGLLTIGFITLLFSSNSPVIHAAFSDPSSAPPVLLLNAAVSVVALVGLIFGGPLLESTTPLPSALLRNQQSRENQANNSKDTIDISQDSLELKAGLELGLWKFFGTTANLYGLSLTTAAHGAFLIQLTTLIVPVVQGILGVPVPKRIQFSVALALVGVFLFTQQVVPTTIGSVAAASDSNSEAIALGDALCVVAAGFYATYDLRLFEWGKLVTPRNLITKKIATQALLSVILLCGVGWSDTVDFVNTSIIVPIASTGGGIMDSSIIWLLLPVVLWSGVAVNAVAPFLQVGGQQAVGPTRAQTLYASQPLWASILAYIFLDETVGTQGAVGGLVFLVALGLAATAQPPDPECGQDSCEV